MSKQELARMLIERGDKRAFNTLRKYTREELEAMLAHTQPATVADTQPAADTQLDGWLAQQPVDTTPSHVPTDRDLYAAALSSKPASEPEKPFPMPTWGATLAFVGVAFLEMIGWK